MHRTLLCLCTVLACAGTTYAQPWYDLMTGPRPNLFEVTRSYEDWYATHPFVKSNRTQEYKRWVRHMLIYADANGLEQRPHWTSSDDAAFLMDRYRKPTDRLQATSSWRGIGPFSWDKTAVGLSYAPGLSHCYVVKEDPRDPSVVWAGTATAGVWKSGDTGRSWTNVSSLILAREVRAICVDAMRSGTAWFGASSGVWKTVNGGSTWTITALAGSFFSDLVVYDIMQLRGQPDVLLVATNRGLQRTTDGGATFDVVRSGTFYELEQHPSSTTIVYAVQRSGDNCQFLKSRDGGVTFEVAGTGLPAPSTSNGEHSRRWEIAVTPAAPARVYLLAAGVMNGGEGLVGIYASTDEGMTFTHRCCGDGPGGAFSPTNPNILAWDPAGQESGGQFYYDLALAVSPIDPDRLYVGGINVWISSDGGRSFSCNAKWTYEPQYRRRYTHADVHEITTIGRRVWVASDGGVFYSSVDLDSTEDRTSGIQGTEFWGWGAGFTDCDVMVGGTYHNGAMLKDGSTYNGWLQIHGGDNGGGLVNYGDARTVYVDRYLGQPWDRITLSGDRTVAPTKQDIGIVPTSNVVLHPWCSTEMWAGTGAGLQRSTDHGRTWNVIARFGDSTVRRIRIVDRKPDAMVLLAKKDTYSTVLITRTLDGGRTFTDITPPSAMSGGNGWRVNDIAVDDEDPDRMWVTLGGFRAGAKVLRTIDGGVTWSDVTAGLPEPAVNCVTYQRGTNGLVYVGTQLGVYVRDDTMDDWQLFSDSLPVAHVTTFDICYREGLVRAATNRGVFETRVAAASRPRALIAADQRVVLCTRDTITFHDHSVADAATVLRTWSFPGGTPSLSAEAHPRVTYSAPGTYPVQLIITDANGTDQYEVVDMITVLSTCNPDDLPGATLYCNGTDGYASMKPINRAMTHATITAWVRVQGRQNDYAGLVFSRGAGTVAGLSIMGNNTLRYHWGDQGWWNVSTQAVPDMTWAHVALVITPDSATMYVNGRGETFALGHRAQTFGGNLQIGRDPTSALRSFRGQIDEVRVYDRALSTTELREAMHRTNASITGLVAYYQFNEDGAAVIDRHGDHHGMLSATAVRESSAAPVGRGVASTTMVSAGGQHTWSGTGCSISWLGNGVVPSADVVVTRLKQTTTIVPQGVARTLPDGLVIVHSFGAAAFDRPLAMTIDDITVQENEAARPADLILYRRAWHGDTAWSDPVGIASAAAKGKQGSIDFTGGNLFTTSSQLVVGSRQTVGVAEARQLASTIAPNPLDGAMTVTVVGEATMELFDLMGRVHRSARVMDVASIDVQDLAPGTYVVRITQGAMTRAEVVVKR